MFLSVAFFVLTNGVVTSEFLKLQKQCCFNSCNVRCVVVRYA